MGSQTECSAGGEHIFNHLEVSQWSDDGKKIIVPYSCSECSSNARQNDVFVRDDDYEYHDCKKDVCSGSENAHNCVSTDRYPSPSGFDEHCYNCNGVRSGQYTCVETTYSEC